MTSSIPNAGFTLGPWGLRIDPYEDDPFPGKDFFTVRFGDDCIQGITEPANAHLIAAAPKLYEALEHILNGALSLPRFAEEEGRAALKQARGEQ